MFEPMAGPRSSTSAIGRENTNDKNPERPLLATS